MIGPETRVRLRKQAEMHDRLKADLEQLGRELEQRLADEGLAPALATAFSPPDLERLRKI